MSLFDHFKHIVARSPHADMNRSTLLIPALCGKWDDATMTQALRQVSHHDLKAWENKNIPYTLRKTRRVFFDGMKTQQPPH
jgi:hypothetical protein